MTVENCTRCQLSSMLPILCHPIKTCGSGDIMFIGLQPKIADIIQGEPYSEDFRVIKKIMHELKKEFSFTYLVHCTGKVLKKELSACSYWIDLDIITFKPKTVFLLGEQVKKKFNPTFCSTNPITILSPTIALRNKKMYEELVNSIKSNI